MEENRQPQILDSGERREFETGAVRDIQEGKGRCDLLPLDAVSGLIGNEQDENGLKLVCVKTILEKLALFQYTKDVKQIKEAVYSFQFSEYTGNGCTTFASMILEPIFKALNTAICSFVRFLINFPVFPASFACAFNCLSS